MVNPGEDLVKATAVYTSHEIITLKKEDYFHLEATVKPNNATVKKVLWESSDTSVATVSPYGRVKAVSLGTAEISAKTIDGSNCIGKCVVKVKDDSYYITNKKTGAAISYENALDGALSGASQRGNVCVKPIKRSDDQIWKLNEELTAANCYIRAYLDDDYGFNAYKTRSGNYNCDLIKVKGNESDAAVRFENQGNGYYKICLTNAPDYYLTLMPDDKDVRWRNTSEGDSQLWQLEAVDWTRHKAERVEYHLLCNGDTSKALRVGRKNVLFIQEEKPPVRGERRSFWNRQKWTIKGNGTQKQICSQLDNEYVLGNDGFGNACISKNTSIENSFLTITPYNGSLNMYEIKLSNSGLYLTLEYNATDMLYWGKWKNYDSVGHSTCQVWKLEKQPEYNHLGVDSFSPVSATTAKILKKNNIEFSVRYYTSLSSSKLLTATEVKNLHSAGLKIVSVY